MTDTTGEFACSLTDREFRERRGMFRERLLPKAVSTSRTGDCLRLVFPNESAIRSEIDAFIDLERQCCGFLTFALSEGPEQNSTVLTISGPPAARTVMDLIAEAITG